MTTTVLSCLSDGNEIAAFLDQPAYGQLLRRAASILRRESPGHLFEPADLVHEALLRIAHSAVPVQLQNVTHLVALSSLVMRRVMVDYSRAEKLVGCLRSDRSDYEDVAAWPASETILVRDALASLADSEGELFQIVEMRFYGGFDMEEIAAALCVSSRTVKRHWRMARDLLYDLLSH